MAQVPRSVRFTGRYRGIRQALQKEKGFRETSLSLKTLRRIWQEGLFDKRRLMTLDGRSLRILSSGCPTGSDGADYSGAHLVIGGKSERMDVICHRTSSEISPPSSNGKPFHVFAHADPKEVNFTAIEVGDRLGPFQKIIEEMEPEDYPIPHKIVPGACSRGLDLPRLERLSHILDEAGDERILEKANRLEARAAEEGWSQALYEGFMDALGYQKNRKSFTALAERLPWRNLFEAGKGDAKRMAAILLGAGGFLDGENPRFEEHFPLWNPIRSQFPSEPRLPWVRARVRPANYPERRLLAASTIFSELMESGLLGLIQIFEEALLENRLRSCYPLLERKGSNALGSERVKTIVVNLLFPAALARARQREDGSLEHAVHIQWRRFSKVSENGVLRATLKRICGERAREFPLKTERRRQGVLQIFKDFCDTKPSSCEMCPFPNLYEKNLPLTDGSGFS